MLKEINDIINCVCGLKDICLDRNIKLLSYPKIDPSRVRMRLFNYYLLLVCVFVDTGIMILVHVMYFISIQEEEPYEPCLHQIYVSQGVCSF